MNYKVIVTAKKSGTGSLSKEHRFSGNPSPEDLQRLQRAAREEFKKVYGNTTQIAVDITVRPGAAED